jgi:hypothetical protein
MLKDHYTFATLNPQGQYQGRLAKIMHVQFTGSHWTLCQNMKFKTKFHQMFI